MLEIKSITKTYKTEGFTQKALDGVSLNFRKCEFASILGPSGSGKTTFLNIIGGLDHYDTGDLIINGVSTKKYKDADWDSYRNHRVGFVFQSYNLITHQTILSNVRLALTLSGISKKEAMERAKKALKDVGLEKHINKKPSQLSGGQMQRVAIARALVNDPDILLADEPTGALDSETSVQIMDLLKKIAKTKLVIMVTHNPELAEKYSNRIIKLKDGKVTEDTNPYENIKDEVTPKSTGKTSMSFLTALSLSFNNLMTKKGRTILVSFAGSIGIIGIALILAVSTGFQNYIDSIQEETLTSYPLRITEESTDITGMLLSMTANANKKKTTDKVLEQQYITNMFSNIKANDLRSFNNYYNKKYKNKDEDISTVTYSYSIDPYIYTIDASNKLTKLNPSNLFSSIYGGGMSTMYSSTASIFSQMTNDQETLNEQYNVLAGRWPKEYNEMIIVLSEPNSISDLLVYSLGLRDNDELTKMVTSIVSGKEVDIHNDPMEFTYEDLMNIKLKLIEPSDIYKYNNNYDVYEDMSNDEGYMKELYDRSKEIKIVGVVCAKEETTAGALSPGVSYRSDLITHIIKYAQESEIVKKQLANPEVDVFSNTRFDAKKNDYNFEFADLVEVDNNMLQSAFNINIDSNALQEETKKYMEEISNSITTDITPATNSYNEALVNTINGFINNYETISLNEIDSKVEEYLNSEEENNYLAKLDEYVIPRDTYKEPFKAILKGFLQVYVNAYYMIDPSLTEDEANPVAKLDETVSTYLDPYINSAAIKTSSETMGKVMTEAKVKKTVLQKVGELTANISASFATAFNIDPNAITGAFHLKFSEDELSRVVQAMFTKTESTEKSNLITLGYQNLEEPTYIAYYFNSFDGKENFIKFISDYNKQMKKDKLEDKVINYTDTTGILMDSVKIIVNAVSYVLIAFVSIALIVSSIMIGIITYISVFERTKEIGILRAIGASKKNISSIFNAETFIIGLLSGLFGIGITYIFIPIINAILHALAGNVPLSASLSFFSSLSLILLSIGLTLLGGLIPAKKASHKDPVEALRSE